MHPSMHLSQSQSLHSYSLSMYPRNAYQCLSMLVLHSSYARLTLVLCSSYTCYTYSLSSPTVHFLLLFSRHPLLASFSRRHCTLISFNTSSHTQKTWVYSFEFNSGPSNFAVQSLPQSLITRRLVPLRGLRPPKNHGKLNALA